MTVAPPPNCPQTGKRAYRSPKAAKAAHRSVSNRLRVYRCPLCRWWHATAQSKEEAP